MDDSKFADEWLRRYRCPWCRKHARPEKCAKKNVAPKHEGFTCRGYRCDFERVTTDAVRR